MLIFLISHLKPAVSFPFTHSLPFSFCLPHTHTHDLLAKFHTTITQGLTEYDCIKFKGSLQESNIKTSLIYFFAALQSLKVSHFVLVKASDQSCNKSVYDWDIQG